MFDLLFYFVGDAKKILELHDVNDSLVDYRCSMLEWLYIVRPTLCFSVDVFADLISRDHISVQLTKHADFKGFLNKVCPF